MNKELLETYSDYLISSFSYTTATGLSMLVEGEISHDKVTRFLSGEDFTSAKLWEIVKSTIREIENEEGVIIFDDTIEEKPSTDENEIVSWHYDHSKGRAVKGINIISALYYSKGARIPVAYDLVRKTKLETDRKTGKEKRVSEKTQNEQYREMLKICIKNNIKFKYVLNDVWYASSENMMYVKKEMEKDFIMPVKTNRKIALSQKDKLNGKYVTVSELELKEGVIYKVYLEAVEFPLLLVKQIFKNDDGTEGILYLVSSDLTLTYDNITTIYQKRWKVEEYHKSLKQHVSLCKSPTKRVRTQSNHIFASIYAFFKLEFLSIRAKVNHAALRSKIYISANRAAFDELKNMKACFAMNF
ncbi:MAG: transposase [Ignavibacteria bacterium RIFOXYB2_FULL_35_12]|nr:MAG: transposase [Ignavibacteria bacterium GWC2_35_8]OGU60476.1 MAG: transposase [Ignavibacteria bacterium GWF2_35_20]OGU84552.1 MAG: transposase [Ignavibacteria bacterium RIFOXYA12_FULL_35_25]OGU96822.1 MAG: transposase [Ignavibacteria bacterium RIFOXYB12_FULL_35_14]OGV01340.1 MAG: transposase [Ignavibacteria bacterium RIFOXYC2_FULL_35_16]OGV05252.1 MAG: transposase [Ignavibacteria bacterium RIFOXYB2_FULL_35_12]OGV29735.1 MAG: transposase [Ignavibacteria bacterium RIFOXYD12_FULL_36_8]